MSPGSELNVHRGRSVSSISIDTYKPTPPSSPPLQPNAPSISSNVGNPPRPVSPKLSGLHRSKLIGREVGAAEAGEDEAAKEGREVAGAREGVVPKRALEANEGEE